MKNTNSLLNPVDYFNQHGSFAAIFDGVKNVNVKSETEVCMLDPTNLNPNDLNKPTFSLQSDRVHILKENPYDLPTNSHISKFMLLTAVKFNRDFFAAMSYVSIHLMKSEIPYIRVGTDYYKMIKKRDRWGGEYHQLKSWKKEEITQDHTKALLSLIFKFDDFTIIPNNVEFIPVANNCYNLYSRFPNSPISTHVTEEDIPVTSQLLTHIFGDQIQLGLQYMKILYEHPQQILPVLSLVSTERETGKTTFLNWIQMLFGQNSILISPTDLTSNFNSLYATKNIIMIDETVLEKSTSIEKLKSLATAKSISVSQKFVQQYSVPFFGKIIICTNKEKDFMRIDAEEVRFWVRKIKPISGKKNTNIEADLFREIPYFLKALTQMPAIDFSQSRMVFTKEQIQTTELEAIKEESKSTLAKDIELKVNDIFLQNGKLTDFKVSSTDIKEKWFHSNNQISLSYIRKVLKEEMKMKLSDHPERYYPFGEVQINSRVGYTFRFVNTISADKELYKNEPDLSPY